jgi:tRNA(Ile)-lysidine synthase
VAAGCKVTAHHVDHGLRDGSAAESEVVRELASRFGTGFESHRADLKPGPNFEARARHARFALLPEQIATGHTLDDRAETMLINLMRGAARTGLSPMRDQRRHPIVALRRAETEKLCEFLDVSVVHDLTNHDPAFVRNRVRHELLPLLNDISRRDVAPLLDRQADLLGAEDIFLDHAAAEIDPTDAKAVAAAPPVLARRALRAFISREWSHDHPPAVDSVERALEVARGLAKSCEIEGGHRIHRTNQKLRLEYPSG